MQDHYAVLGVEPSASADRITSAYRLLIRALHPDAHAGRSVAPERFAQVVAAHDTLRDAARRAAYDAERARMTARRVASARPPRTAVMVVGLAGRPAAPRGRRAPLRIGPVRIEVRWTPRRT